MSDNAKNSVGKQLKQLRIKNNFTQKEIAEFLNITLRAYQYYEVDQRFPPIETIVALSHKYNVPFLKVLYGDITLIPISLTFENKSDSVLYDYLSKDAKRLGITIDEIASYILLNHTFND